MAKTITIDKVEVTRVQLLRNPDGEIQVFAEYHLKGGNQILQAKHEQIGTRLSGARRAAALALFEALSQEVEADELA